MRTDDDKKKDQASPIAHDGGIDPQQGLTGTTRRSLLQSAVLFAMFSGGGIGLTACGGGGGGHGGGGGFGGGGGGGRPPDGPSSVFKHGIASGDPLSDRVIIWTRVTASAPGTINLDWEVASDEGFGIIVARGTASAGPERDYTVKVDVTGLQAASTYFYRFAMGGDNSPVGRTKTLPVGGVSQAKLAVVSCSNFPSGYFNVYAEIAKRTDIDVVLHLGDYIYEYGRVGYASQLAIAIDRESNPDHELLSLTDYRLRHAQYRTDNDLRALHARLPMIAVWDDHDVADDAWSGGAENHDESTEGSFAARRAAAVQAYHEWLPTRLPDPANPLRIYRSFDIGTLASMHMLDTRLIGRDKQVTLSQYLAGEASASTRQLLGQPQVDWLSGRMAASPCTWQVLGQQVLMMRMHIPLSVAANFSLETLTEYLAALALPESARSESQRALIAQQKVPYNLDAWDGYPAARDAVLAMARSQGKNLISLAGDTHNAWAGNLTDSSGQRVGVEFGTSSVSSPGFERALPLIANDLLSDGFKRMVDDLRYAETSKRGYAVLTLTTAEARCEYIEISTVFSRDYSVRLAATLRVLPGVGNLQVLAA
ncbi:alkaline phosphatase [Variovorax sp. OV700]|uniref:alkaline phosphatase D family protein n=1 Tax=Variovorax sp. OV700 TaxID=1882826 RepID=UPI00088C6D56|nr:alkaline phosphatase D family protein [Variovorax sp. OV700]SDH74996.1 alkaline phosphatase D [Variovorax sp. OV700]